MAGTPLTNPGEVQMHGTDIQTFIDIMDEAEQRYKALAALEHTTEAEQQLLLLKAAVAQSASLQASGMLAPATPGAIDWAVQVAEEHRS